MNKIGKVTAQEQVSKLLNRYSSLLEHSDFVYGYFDDMQSEEMRMLPAVYRQLDSFVTRYRDEPWKINFLTAQDFCETDEYNRGPIPNEIMKIIGSKKIIAHFNTITLLEKYPFISPLLQADSILSNKVKWPRGQIKSFSFSHSNKEIDLVGAVLFLTEVEGYQQNAVFQFIAQHGGHVGAESVHVDSGQLSYAADNIRKKYTSMKSGWDELNFGYETLQNEVREVLKSKEK